MACFLCLITHLTEWLPLHNALIFFESSCRLGQHTQDGLLLFGLEFEHTLLCLLNDGRGRPAWRAKSTLGSSDPQRSPQVRPVSPPGHLCEGCHLGEFPLDLQLGSFGHTAAVFLDLLPPWCDFVQCRELLTQTWILGWLFLPSAVGWSRMLGTPPHPAG